MNEEIKLILESQRMLLWENWRKWNSVSKRNNGDGSCIETNEIEDLVKRINETIKPKDREPTLAEQTNDALKDDANYNKNEVEND